MEGNTVGKDEVAKEVAPHNPWTGVRRNMHRAQRGHIEGVPDGCKLQRRSLVGGPAFREARARLPAYNKGRGGRRKPG
eukprot:260719-Chlamydomonas_euryale.AAC.1